MRNPLMNYYFLGFERFDKSGQLVSKHFRMCTSWFWVRPAVILAQVESKIVEDLKCSEKDLILTAFNKN